MRVSEVLAGLEGVDPSSDIRVWADGMRVMTTRYGSPVSSTDRGLRVISRGYDPYEDDDELTTPVVAREVPHDSFGFRKDRWVQVKPKWKLPEATYIQTPSGRNGLSDVVHYFDLEESRLTFTVDEAGAFGKTHIMARAWCGLRTLDEYTIADSMAPANRLCKTCERKFDEWHTACESCGVITHNDEMHSLGGDRWGDGGLSAFPSECERCYQEREKIEEPYRRVVGGELG